MAQVAEYARESTYWSHFWHHVLLRRKQSSQNPEQVQRDSPGAN